MRQRGLSFNDAVDSSTLNGEIRAIDEPKRTTSTFNMGKPPVSVEKALQLAGILDDEALVHGGDVLV